MRLQEEEAMPVQQALLRKFQQLLARRDFTAASEVAEALYAQDPNDETALKACVQVFVRSGRLDRAIDVAGQLLRQDPGNLGYVTNLAKWSVSLGRREQACAYYEDYLERKPDDPRGLFGLGMLCRDLGDTEQAVKLIERAIDTADSPPAEYYLQLALIYADHRREARAVACLEQLLAIEPDHVLGQFNLATLHQAAGRRQEAERMFEDILQRDPAFSEALVRLIYGRRMTPGDGDWLRKAERRARRGMTPALDRERLNFALAKAYDDLQDYPQAFARARTANDLQQQRIGPYDASQMSAFVDRSIAAVTPEWLQAGDGPGTFAPIFILGHFRSGSTLVEQILSGHSATVALGEVDFFLRLWHEDPDAYFSLFEAAQPDGLRALGRRYRDQVRYLADREGRSVDKRPENLLFMGLIRRMFPGARFIHTRRRLRDNAVSVYFQQLNDLSRFGTSLLDFAEYDRQCERLMQHWRQNFGEVIHTVDYEQLVGEPEATVRDLLRFLDLDWEPACLDFKASRNFVRTASVAQVREGIHTRSVGRGDHYFPLFSPAEQSAYKGR
jgi:tetratricopeptide (TPR) repeat protein